MYRPTNFLMRQLIALNAPGCWRRGHQGPATGSMGCRCRAFDSKWTLLPSVLLSVCVLVLPSLVYINVYAGHWSQLMDTKLVQPPRTPFTRQQVNDILFRALNYVH